MNYLSFVERINQLNIDAEKISSTPDRCYAPLIKPDAKNILIFSPHPDDESITGALALRLRKEANFQIINIPVTLGSDPHERPRRRQELEAACAVLDFSINDISESGLINITPAHRTASPLEWQSLVEITQGVIKKYEPVGIFFPHNKDLHPTHMGVNQLVFDALSEVILANSIALIEYEYWQAMQDPNLMVESSNHDVALLIKAIACHEGEVKRNPYHIRQISWMADNVRRGSEVIGSLGAQAKSYQFATLYRLSLWNNGEQRIVETKTCIDKENLKIKELLEL